MKNLARLDCLMLTLLVLLVLLIVLLVKTPPQPLSHKIIIIDGCEYIQFSNMHHPVLHKGNCTNHLQSVKKLEQ